ncbi:DUF4362 domain-containing protein [Actinoplanes sp. NPDC051470]|uniref:DUF4362 domain-containing protein n=1 Tax=Actinoplanes sp. NPDC051470 TaxID=3157224 RepID=UPI003415B758
MADDQTVERGAGDADVAGRPDPAHVPADDPEHRAVVLVGQAGRDGAGRHAHLRVVGGQQGSGVDHGHMVPDPAGNGEPRGGVPPPMRRVLILAVPLALAACAPDDMPRTEQPVPVTSLVVSCGTFDLKLTDPLPATAARCLTESVAEGRPARLQISSNTDEGDPIITTYSSGPDGRVEVVTDTRQDKFGPRRVTVETCTGITAKERSFDVTGCTEPEERPTS